jgi:molybdopterin molybdotransferase
MIRKDFLRLTDADEFRRITFAIDRLVGREGIPTADALGRIPAVDIVSPIDLPEFCRSTVDGFAVMSADTHGASDSIPAYLELIDDIPIGTAPGKSARPGGAARVVTGGMIPEGADAVVMLEYTQVVDGTTLEVRRPVAALENVASVGEDIRRSDAVVPAGRPLRPFDIGALMGVGITEVEVYQKPRVAVFSTGDEVVEPTDTPPVGKVRDVNKYAVAAGVAEAGGTPILLPNVADDLGLLRETIKKGIETTDLVILSGGSSVGGADFSLEAINEIGSPGVLVHGLAVRPGKPTIYGVAGDVPIFGLPGHPAGAMVIFILFVAPLIRKIGGNKEIEPFGTAIPATITRSVNGSPGRHVYVPVTIEAAGPGLTLRAVPILGKSGAISILTRSRGIVEIPPMKGGLEAGETALVYVYRQP